MDNLHFKGPGFEFNAVGPIAIVAAVVIAFVVLAFVHGYMF